MESGIRGRRFSSSGFRRAPRVWLVHGEPASQTALAAALREEGYTAEAPVPRQRVALLE
jgi:hypothetical protein